MRIVGGTHRGRALAALGKGDPAAQLRPTADRVRESLFNILVSGVHGDAVTGAHVLDLFAGTGALGLEALSRGAAHAVFVERGRKAQALVARNIGTLGLDAKARLLRADATRLPQAPRAFDLVFLDPPYDRQLGEAAMASALAGGWVAPGATIVWEERAPPRLPVGVEPCDTRRYGETTLTIARFAGPPDPR